MLECCPRQKGAAFMDRALVSRQSDLNFLLSSSFAFSMLAVRLWGRQHMW